MWRKILLCIMVIVSFLILFNQKAESATPCSDCGLFDSQDACSIGCGADPLRCQQTSCNDNSNCWKCVTKMDKYCYIPPFVAAGASAPGLVMLVMGRDHKLYYEAYNDASDLDDDGKIDVGYKHSITYYGYFDPYKCYEYGKGGNAIFTPSRKTSDKYCGGNNEWSGNFLNWLTMSRMDVLRKVLYGGHRVSDSETETVLAGAYIPQDAHSWGKEISEISGERSYVPNIDKLVPFGKPESGKRHLLCVVSKNDGDVPVIRVLKNKDKRIWDWVSKERPVCDNSLGTPDEYVIKVKVCDSSVGLEPNCKKYCPPGSGNCAYKPIGLLQKYGEYSGSSKWCEKSHRDCASDADCDQATEGKCVYKKWCSKSLKNCKTDADCNIETDGLCVDYSKMYFGLITGSYTKNLSGGVLRKNIWSIMDEVNINNGIFQTSENTPGNIILTLDRMQVIGFRYSNHSYQDSSGGNCGWISSHPLQEGECRMWGNPIAEMMYEALRYLAGKKDPTSNFNYSGTQDSTLKLPKPDWGIKQGSTYYQVPQLFPWCSKPFMIILSDINTSYDSDSLPGSSFGTLTGDLQNLNVTTLANTIGSKESISGNYFIGESGSQNDFVCSPKNVSSLATIRGLCPEEPTKQGSYYSAAVAYYGNTAFSDNFPRDNKFNNVKTYSVALASPIPDIAIKVGDNTVRISPSGKSVSGCLGVNDNCNKKCTLSKDSNGNFIISNCQSGSFCPTNQIVDFYVDQVNYDQNGNLTYAKFRINFEDVEQGADHDMDAIILYEITPIGNNQIKVKLTSEYAAGCIDQVLGFFISGTTEDGQWLVVKDKDASSDEDTPDVVANMPLTWEKTFTVSGNAAGQLKDPLWYAAKWGGFDDINGNNKPDLTEEWDKDGNGIPDTYFRVTNPLKMEEQLERVFLKILDRVSSGTTVVALPPSSTVEASVLARAYFYPEKTYESGPVKWIGELSTLWFHSIRENTDNTGESETKKILDIMKDYPLAFVFNPNTSLYEGYVYNDLNSDGEPKSCSSTQKKLEDIIPIFASGSMLVKSDPGTRFIRTAVDDDNDGKISSSEVKNFDPEDSELRSKLQTYWSYDDLGICNDDCAKSVIKYIRGYDKPDPSGASFRLRQSDSTTINNKATFKLGDIIYSTPKIAPNTAVNGYDVKYGDSTYSEFLRKTIKDQTPIIIVGANDGMIHAFRLGSMKDIVPPTNNNGGRQVTKLISCLEESTSCSNPLGKEEWSYIPYNVLPYLRWYCQESYCHIPMLETTFTIVDASVGSPENPQQNPTGDKNVNSWRRLLIAQMGLGGTPITVGGKTFSSSIIVMDITDHLNPVLLWEQPLPDRTLTFATPGIVRLGDGDKNGQWYLVIGSGPTAITTTNLSYPASPKIYVFDLKTGELKATLSIPDVSNQAVGDILSTDLDLPMGDYNVDDLYFGTYNDSSGAFYRLRIRNGNSYLTDPNQWKITRIINVGRPVFAAPSVAHDENGMRWLYFGTGIYLTASHAIPTDEKFFGLIEPDECWTGSGTCIYVEEDELLDTTNTTFTDGKAEQYVCQCSGGIQISSGYCTINSDGSVDCPGCPSGADQVITEVRDAVFSGVDGCNGLTKLEAIECVQRKIYEYGKPPYKKGWKRTMAREKLYSSPVVVGGAVLATPFKPTDDVCSAGGNTTMLALYYTTGTPYYQPLIRAPGGTEGNKNDLTIKPETVIAVGPPPTKTSIVLRQHEDTVTALTQVSGGVISTEIRNPMAVKDKCFQWIVK